MGQDKACAPFSSGCWMLDVVGSGPGSAPMLQGCCPRQLAPGFGSGPGASGVSYRIGKNVEYDSKY